MCRLEAPSINFANYRKHMILDKALALNGAYLNLKQRYSHFTSLRESAG